MFCEKCGTQVDATQPFCPNCGNRIAAPEPTPEKHGGSKLTLKGPLFEKFNAMEKMEQLYYLITVCLLPVCFILSMLKVYYPSKDAAVSLAVGAAWLLVFATIYFTVAIGLVILEHLGKLEGKWIWFFIAGGAAAILVMYLLTWIAGIDVMYELTMSTKLSVGGWFFLIFQAGLTASSILLLIEKLKQKK